MSDKKWKPCLLQRKRVERRINYLGNSVFDLRENKWKRKLSKYTAFALKNTSGRKNKLSYNTAFALKKTSGRINYIRNHVFALMENDEKEVKATIR